MTTDEFMIFVRYIRSAIPSKEPFLSNRNNLETWWIEFESLKSEYLMLAARRYTRTERFLPTIADILTRYREIEEHNRSLANELKDIYRLIHRDYPTNLWGEDDEKAFMNAIRSKSFDECKKKAMRLLKRTETEILDKPFAEFVRS